MGHVFQGRYKGILVERDQYLLKLARYVVLNPVRANRVKDIKAWKWSSYQSMIGEETAPSWLEVHWILQQFSKQRKRAIERYIEFVREGIGLPTLWGDLKNQIFLGSEAFVNNKQKQIKEKEFLSEVPHLQKRKLPRPLEYYAKQYSDQKIAITHAYLSGGYTLKEIGNYFGLHYSTISRIVKANE